MLLTFCQEGGLSSNLGKLPNNNLVPVDKSQQGVGDTDLGAELPDEDLGAAEVVARDPRVQVVNGLELQTAVEEVKPLGAVDVHGGAQHLLGKRLGGTQVGGTHGEVGQRELRVQRHGHHVADQDECEPVQVVRNRTVHDAVGIPVPEEGESAQLYVRVPPCRTLPGSLAEQDELEREAVKVEAPKHEEDVEGVVLNRDQDLCHSIVLEDAFVVGRAQGTKQTVGDGHEGQVLDIRVMFR